MQEEKGGCHGFPGACVADVMPLSPFLSVAATNVYGAGVVLSAFPRTVRLILMITPGGCACISPSLQIRNLRLSNKVKGCT